MPNPQSLIENALEVIELERKKCQWDSPTYAQSSAVYVTRSGMKFLKQFLESALEAIRSQPDLANTVSCLQQDVIETKSLLKSTQNALDLEGKANVVSERLRLEALKKVEPLQNQLRAMRALFIKVQSASSVAAVLIKTDELLKP